MAVVDSSEDFNVLLTTSITTIYQLGHFRVNIYGDRIKMNGSLATFNDMDYFWPGLPCFLDVLERSLYYLFFVRFLLNCNILEQETNVKTSVHLPSLFHNGLHQVHH